MRTLLETLTATSLDEVVAALAGWQRDDGTVQLHPGDLGWAQRLGAERLVADLRAWRRGEVLVAVGLLDGPGLVRLGVSPEVAADADVAAQVAADLSDPARGVLPPGAGAVEVRSGPALQELLGERGWTPDEPWSPLSRDLAAPVADGGLRVEVVGPHDVRDRVEVHRASFGGTTFTEQAWHAMASGAAYRGARCLVARDASGAAVAATTVWAAGPGRPGVIEPLGVHRDHRGAGHGTALTLAAAAALRELGASSATVCTPSSNVAAVATYAAAGLARLPEVTDLRRPDAAG